MADTDPEQENAAPRRRSLTPEQRRLLGTPRPVSQRHHEEAEEPAEPPGTPAPDTAPEAPASGLPASESAPAETRTGKDRRLGSAAGGETKNSRTIEMQRALLVLGVLVLIVLLFYAGRKFDHVKALVMSRMNKNELQGGPEKFPGVTPEELVEAALAAEKNGDWEGATQRLIEAKRKDLRYQGIFFRIGKGSFDRGDWEGADLALAQALKFGENIAVANHLRGLIAVRRHDLTAAERYFEAAATAEPFVTDFFFFWGEALRLNQHPREAIRRYEQAIHRTQSTTDATLCHFKIRLARIEAAEAAAVRAEVEAAREVGPLSVDWLMTDAALQLQAGDIPKAVQSISDARAQGVNGLFLTCAGDTIFQQAAGKHPEIAALVAQPAPAGKTTP